MQGGQAILTSKSVQAAATAFRDTYGSPEVAPHMRANGLARQKYEALDLASHWFYCKNIQRSVRNVRARIRITEYILANELIGADGGLEGKVGDVIGNSGYRRSIRGPILDQA